MSDPPPPRPWLKLWTSLLTDPDFNTLDLPDQARWVRLFVYVGVHGAGGQLTLKGGVNLLSGLLRIKVGKQIHECLERLPNVRVDAATFPAMETTITFSKWRKYQDDSSTERTRAWRSRRRSGDANASSPVTTNNRHNRPTGDGVRGEERREESLTPCERGTNPRATGSNPRALGTNPRALGTNPRAADPDTDPAHLRFNIPDA